MLDLRRPRECRFCGRLLTRIEQMHGAVCHHIDCRRAAALEQQQARRDEDLAARRRAAAVDGIEQAPVVWLHAHRTRLVRLSAAERQAQLAHLQRLVDEAPAPAPAPPAPPSGDGLAMLGALCGFCGGRCCREGAYSHAFIDRAMLQRWVDQHPGRTLHDATAAYAERLPAQHVQGSCLHHTNGGCSLPREMRSAICNRYACAGLEQARASDAAALVVAMPGPAGVQRAVWVSAAGGTRRLPRRRSAGSAAPAPPADET